MCAADMFDAELYYYYYYIFVAISGGENRRNRMKLKHLFDVEMIQNPSTKNKTAEKNQLTGFCV